VELFAKMAFLRQKVAKKQKIKIFSKNFRKVLDKGKVVWYNSQAVRPKGGKKGQRNGH